MRLLAPSVGLKESRYNGAVRLLWNKVLPMAFFINAGAATGPYDFLAFLLLGIFTLAIDIE